MVVKELLKKATVMLESVYGTGAELEAKKLWIYMKDQKEIDFVNQLYEEVSLEDKKNFEQAVLLRLKQMPVQYIFNYAYFWNRKFMTKAGVLIPRFDSEFLVEEVLKRVENHKSKILELGVGSGALAITIPLETDSVSITGTDISKRALALAEQNAKYYDVNHRISWIESDGFQRIDEKYDIIYSNPPYIPYDEYIALSKEVFHYEPKSALLAEKKGLDFYLKWTPESIPYLRKDGSLCFEVGYNQGDKVKEIMKNYGFVNIVVKKDFAGHDRVVVGSLPNEV